MCGDFQILIASVVKISQQRLQTALASSPKHSAGPLDPTMDFCPQNPRATAPNENSWCRPLVGSRMGPNWCLPFKADDLDFYIHVYNRLHFVEAVYIIEG